MEYNFKINEILRHYLIAVLWTEELDDREVSEISDDSIVEARADIEKFVAEAGDLLNDIEPSQIGHDFWLTRNGHGAGFWDRDLGEVGDKLTKICEGYVVKNVWGDPKCEIIIE